MGIRGRLRFIRKPLSLIGKLIAAFAILFYCCPDYRSCGCVSLNHRSIKRL